MHILTELPFDVVQFIASFLLPYDVLALSTTCRTLKPLITQRAVWIQVAESVSRSRPLPFTATQALDLPIEELVSSCLRAQRIARGWSDTYIYPRTMPVKISFPDKRIITYFTFLPGSRHLMVHDTRNVLSCWTVHGRLLDTWRVQYGAKLTRWKPCDESENTYNFRDGRVQAVEIMIEFPMRARPTRCEILLLTYSGAHARFEAVSKFNIPRVFEPFSAMTQDELRGSLVRIDSQPERVGIYLTDKNTEKAVCVDTGLSLVLECVPQALLSSSHVVLYWETLSSAHTYSYEIDVLRSVLAREGRSQDDPMLKWPISLAPSDVRAIPFRTINADTVRPLLSPCALCRGCGTVIEQPYFPSTDLSMNRSAYPIIIPKWNTLREDLKRHRTRSVLCFSQRPSTAMEAQSQALATYVNGPQFGMMNVQLLDEGGNPADYGAGPAPTENGQTSATHHSSHSGHSIHSHLPRITITHHYFDYAGSSSGCAPQEVVRTILADAPLRRPQSLRIHREALHVHVGAMGEDEEFFDDDVEIEEIGVHHFGGYDDEDLDEDGSEGDLIGDGIELEDMGDIDFGDAGVEGLDEQEEEEQFQNDYHDHGEWHEHDNAHNDPPPINEGTNDGDVAVLQHDLEGLGLELGDLQGDVPPPMLVDDDGSILNLTPEAAQALMDILQDPLGGSPVMGYGGRCAMWVEEHPRKYRANGRAPVLRVATFPTYKPSSDDRDDSAPVHPELEVSRAHVGTFHLPDDIALESSYTFDLDDVRGIVGIATLFGELWLVDFS